MINGNEKVDARKIGLFVHDGPIFRDVNLEYGGTIINNDYIQQFYCVVDFLVIISRIKDIPKSFNEMGLEKLDLNRLSIVGAPNINSPKGFFVYREAIRDIVCEQIKFADGIFLTMPSNLSFFAAEQCIISKRRYLSIVGGCAWDSYWNHSFLGKVIAPYMLWNEKRYVMFSDYVVYVTEEWLQKRYPSEGKKICASNVVLPVFDDTILEKRIEKIGKNQALPLKIGTIASVDVKYKGQEYIIKAISKLKKEGIIMQYEMVGVGEGNYLKKIIEENDVNELVVFKGALNRRELFEWLDTIDIYAQPSKQEGLPRALIEAMSRGCPAIGTRIAGIPELLGNHFMFLKGDVNEIVSILKKLCSDEVRKMEAVRNYSVSKKYEYNVIKKKKEKFYDEYMQNVN